MYFFDVYDLNGKASNSTTIVMGKNTNDIHYKIYDENDRELNNFIPDKGEIIVPVSYKTLYQCKIGDVVSLTWDGETIFTYRIAAYFEDPFMGASLMGIKTLLISDSDFDRLFYDTENFRGQGILLSIFKKAGSSMSDADFEAYLNRETSYAGYSWISLSRTQAYNYMTMLTNIFSAILVAFVVLLVVATLIVLGHNISSSIEQDFVNLGILKACGMTNHKIRLSILCGYFFAGVVGALVGIPVAIPVIGFVNRITRPAVGLYVENSPAVLQSLIAILVILVIIALFITLKLTKIARISPVSAINGGRKDIHFSGLFKLPISKKVLGTSLAYRQLSSGKKRYIGALLITAILTMFMVMISDMCIYFSDEDELENMFSPVSYEFRCGATYDDDWNEKVSDVDEIISQYTQFNRYVYESRYVMVCDTQMWCGIISDPSEIKNVYKGRTCTYDNEILITEYLTKNYGIEIGDKVVVGVNGKNAEFIAVGYYQCTNDSGKNITMSLDGYNRIIGDDGKNKAYNYVYSLAEPDLCDDILNAINEKYGEDEFPVYKNQSWHGMHTITNALFGITALIYVLSGFFIAITVSLVCTKIFVKEKQDYGIFKAIGFTSVRLRGQFAIRFVICAFVGAVLGITLTAIFSEAILNAILQTFGMYNFSSSINAIALFIPIGFMMLVYFIFAYFVSGKMKKVTPRILISE